MPPQAIVIKERLGTEGLNGSISAGIVLLGIAILLFKLIRFVFVPSSRKITMDLFDLTLLLVFLFSLHGVFDMYSILASPRTVRIATLTKKELSTGRYSSDSLSFSGIEGRFPERSQVFEKMQLGECYRVTFSKGLLQQYSVNYAHLIELLPKERCK
jgi:hypothetical protein